MHNVKSSGQGKEVGLGMHTHKQEQEHRERRYGLPGKQVRFSLHAQVGAVHTL